MTRYDLIIFDCDGVLVDSEPIANDVEVAFFETLGLQLTASEARALFKGRTTTEVARVVEQRAAKPLPPSWQYEWAMATALAFVDRLQPTPGVRALLELVGQRGVRRCVASQSPLARVKLSLQITGLSGYFDEHIYTASMVARAKPAPDLFLFAAAQSGVDPEKCVVIEDSESGVRAATAAAMKVYGYAAGEEPTALDKAGATVFNSMQQLPSLLGL